MNKKEKTPKNRINENIPYWYKSVRIVSEGIESKIVSLDEAKKIADDMELDLIEINSQSNPPILRIGNYEKIQYEAKKKMWSSARLHAGSVALKPLLE
jgi:translation initiation factor IF-3